MERLELAVIVSGLSIDDVPVHPVKRYSSLGVAEIVNKDPDFLEPPEVSTEPPSDAETTMS